VRECFVARPGSLLVSVDFSQIEPRVAAALSGDDRLKLVFSDGRDLYADMARRLFKLELSDTEMTKEPAKTLYRQPAKIILLGCVLYGMQADRLFDELIRWGCGTPSEPFYTLEMCENFVRRRFEPYPQLAALAAETVAHARREDGWARTLGNRRRFLPALLCEGHRWPAAKLREEAERQAFNHLIQGTAQEIMKVAMLRAAKVARAQPLLQVYDEMVYEVPEDHAHALAIELAGRMAAELSGVSITAGWSVASSWGGLK
jgi:DNA polymerase-1